MKLVLPLSISFLSLPPCPTTFFSYTYLSTFLEYLRLLGEVSLLLVFLGRIFLHCKIHVLDLELLSLVALSSESVSFSASMRIHLLSISTIHYD